MNYEYVLSTVIKKGLFVRAGTANIEGLETMSTKILYLTESSNCECIDVNIHINFDPLFAYPLGYIEGHTAVVVNIYTLILTLIFRSPICSVT